MKVAIFSESDVDGAAIRVLVEGILGASTEPVALGLRARSTAQIAAVEPCLPLSRPGGWHKI